MAKHVVFVDAKHLLSGSLWTDVVFKSNDEIDQLIEALQHLKTNRQPRDYHDMHIHLQDYIYMPGRIGPIPSEHAEIIFHGPDYWDHSDGLIQEQRPRFASSARELLDE